MPSLTNKSLYAEMMNVYYWKLVSALISR